MVIRKDYYNEFVENNTIKYFAFTERYRKDVGYLSETDLHFELCNNRIIKKIKNNDFTDKKYINKNKKCINCKFKRFSIIRACNNTTKSFEELLKQYGIDM